MTLFNLSHWLKNEIHYDVDQFEKMNKPDGTKTEYKNRRLSERRSWIIYDLITMVSWSWVVVKHNNFPLSSSSILLCFQGNGFYLCCSLPKILSIGIKEAGFATTFNHQRITPLIFIMPILSRKEYEQRHHGWIHTSKNLLNRDGRKFLQVIKCLHIGVFTIHIWIL